MKTNKFDRFIRFGAIGDEVTRKEIVENLWNALMLSSEYPNSKEASKHHNFNPTIQQILSHSTLRELCSKSPELTEQIIQEILDFINHTQRTINKTENPFEEEVQLLQEFNNIPKIKATFLPKWENFKNFLSKNYASQEIDTNFYEKEFVKSLDNKEELFTNIEIKTKWKTEHASKADLIGVHESDDLSSLLPSEVALLADEDTEWLFYKKFAEKKLQTFEYQARMLCYLEKEFQDKRQKEKEDKKGPFIICVDTSGSMHGTPETVAKVLSLAILKIAIRDNRKCYLISFSTGIETLNLTDLKNSLDKIISFLSMSFYGGTDAIPAMKEALRMLNTEDYKKADIIMVSDFVMAGFDTQTKEQILKAKENKTKFHSLVIGSSQNQAVIQEFDNNWFYNPTQPENLIYLTKNIQQL